MIMSSSTTDPKQFSDKVIDAASNAIFAVDADDNIVMANDTAIEMLGCGSTSQKNPIRISALESFSKSGDILHRGHLFNTIVYNKHSGKEISVNVSVEPFSHLNQKFFSVVLTPRSENTQRLQMKQDMLKELNSFTTDTIDISHRQAAIL